MNHIRPIHQSIHSITKPGSVKLKISDYSTKRMSDQLVKEIKQSLKSIESHGSVEIYVQDSTVTQITVRNIHKTHNHFEGINSIQV
jgi:hypothetical protein